MKSKFDLDDEVYVLNEYGNWIKKGFILNILYNGLFSYELDSNIGNFYAEESLILSDNYNPKFELGDKVYVTFPDKKSIIFGEVCSITEHWDGKSYNISIGDPGDGFTINIWDSTRIFKEGQE